MLFFFFSSRRRHTRFDCDWSSDVCSSDLRGLPPRSLRFEVMVETTQSIFAEDGTIALPRFISEGRGRIVAAHFGTYDYTASCGIIAAYQHMLHPACEFAKHVMQVALAGTGVW